MQLIRKTGRRIFQEISNPLHFFDIRRFRAAMRSLGYTMEESIRLLKSSGEEDDNGKLS